MTKELTATPAIQYLRTWAANSLSLIYTHTHTHTHTHALAIKLPVSTGIY